MPKTATRSHTRAASFRPSTFSEDGLTVDLRWTTGSEVTRSSWFDGDFIERLETGAENVDLSRLNAGAALLNSHDGSSLDNVLGVVERAWLADGDGWATVRFSSRPEVAGIVSDVRSGILRNVSVGYQITDTVVEKREDIPLVRVTRWQPHELSLVAVPADPGAQTRDLSLDDHPPTHRDMTKQAQAGVPAEPQTINTSADAGEAKQAPGAATRSAAPAEEAAPSPSEVQALRTQAELATLAARAKVDGDKLERLLACDSVTDGAILIATWAGERASDQVIDHEDLSSGRRSVPGAGQLVVTRAEGSDLDAGLRSALHHRARPVGRLQDEGRRFVNHSLSDMASALLERAGVSTMGMSKMQLVGRAFHSIDDFAVLFVDTAERVMLDAYDEEPHEWDQLAYRRDFRDFREVKEVALSANMVPSLLLESGEYKATTIKTDEMAAQLVSYGRSITVSRQMIINDDLSAITSIPERMGRGARILEHNLVMGPIIGDGPTSIDGLPLYDASHSNTGTGALSIQSLSDGYTAMRLQTDPSGERMNLAPAALVVPAALELEARQLVEATLPLGSGELVQGTGINGPNIYRGRLSVIVDSRLDEASSTQFHLVANPNRIPTVRYGYLSGESGPVIEPFDKRNPDGTEILIRHDFGVSLSDFRGFYRSTGV